MKRRILSLLLSLVLCLGIASPALMASEFTLIPFPEKVSTFGYHYFHNGLAPVMTEDGWRYITTDGRLIDYGHMYIFDYSEGYAAFADVVGGELKVGYMDVYGNTVIPARYDLYEFGSGRVGTGLVINGNVLVWDRPSHSWLQIDLSGRQVKRTMEPVDGDTLYSDWFGNTNGVSYATVTIDGEERELAFSEGCALTDGYIVKGEGAYEGDFPETPPAGKGKLEIFFSSRHFSEVADGLVYSYVITNNTGEDISGYYALMVYRPEHDTYHLSAQFTLFDLQLKAGEQLNGEFISMFKDLSNQKMCWIKFDDKAERDAFFSDSAFSHTYNYINLISDKHRDLAWLEAMLGVKLER